METVQKKRGRPRSETKTLYTTVIMTKKQRDKLDEYMWDNRLRMSYSKFIEYCLKEMDATKLKTKQIEDLLENLKST
jgi:hypothetical protein